MKRIGAVTVGILVIAVAVHPSHTADKTPETGASIRLAESPEKIYSENPNDSWNRIFCSRRVTARLSSEFPEAAPFEKVSDIDFMHLKKSTRAFERNETGDRATDPLYPSFLVDDGIRVLLKDPVYADFKKALLDGLAETATRDAMARATMHSDLWSAYDIVFRVSGADGTRGYREDADRSLRS